MPNNRKFLNKISKDSRSILEDYLLDAVKSVRFFSYGSNMNEKKFKTDMKGKLGLVNKATVTLKGFKRKLSNKSTRHGVAFSICESPDDEVQGICHDIPTALIEIFLRKEGVLSLDRSSYRIIKVSIPRQGQVLSLIGLREIELEKLSPKDAKMALEYVQESIQGAECCDAEHEDMIEAKKKLKDVIRDVEKGA